MGIPKRIAQAGVMAAGVVTAAFALSPDTSLGRAVRRAIGRWPGYAYRLTGKRPDPHVSDDILADRIRSTIGPIEKHLDIPRVHVMVDHGVAILHGVVPRVFDADAVEYAVLAVSGVEAVESHLHIGLTPGDSRPSDGRYAEPPSHALQSLVDAAAGAGADDPFAAVHAVLCGFTDRLPPEERRHVFAHLPGDVRDLSGPPRRLGAPATNVRTVAQLVAAVSADGDVAPERGGPFGF